MPFLVHAKNFGADATLQNHSQYNITPLQCISELTKLIFFASICPYGPQSYLEEGRGGAAIILLGFQISR